MPIIIWDTNEISSFVESKRRREGLRAAVWSQYDWYHLCSSL